MTATIVKIGNSNGIIIPAKILKSLQLAERDSLEIRESDGGLFLKKVGASNIVTPFSALDKWNETHGFTEGFSVEESLDYVNSLRKRRNDKKLAEW